MGEGGGKGTREGEHGQGRHALTELVGRGDGLELDERLCGDVMVLTQLLATLKLLDVIQRIPEQPFEPLVLGLHFLQEADRA